MLFTSRYHRWAHLLHGRRSRRRSACLSVATTSACLDVRLVRPPVSCPASIVYMLASRVPTYVRALFPPAPAPHISFPFSRARRCSTGRMPPPAARRRLPIRTDPPPRVPAASTRHRTSISGRDVSARQRASERVSITTARRELQ